MFSFYAVEVLGLTLTVLALRASWRDGFSKFATAIVAMLFGFAIEAYFVLAYGGYSYGDFLLSISLSGHAVPLWVAGGWGAIIYATSKFSDTTKLPWWARPALDALLAVSADLVLDPLAEHFGWWHWIRPGQFFGVPCDNFIGWMLIVGGFSLATRSGYHYLEPGKHKWRDALIPVAAVPVAVSGVACAQLLLDKAYKITGEPLLFVGLYCASIIFVVGARTRSD